MRSSSARLGGAVGVSVFSAVILSMLAAHLGAGQGHAELNDILRPGPALDAVQPYLGKAFGMFFGAAAALCAASVLGFLLPQGITAPRACQQRRARDRGRISNPLPVWHRLSDMVAPNRK